jgi:hypothetical protein
MTETSNTEQYMINGREKNLSAVLYASRMWICGLVRQIQIAAAHPAACPIDMAHGITLMPPAAWDSQETVFPATIKLSHLTGNILR